MKISKKLDKNVTEAKKRQRIIVVKKILTLYITEK